MSIDVRQAPHPAYDPRRGPAPAGSGGWRPAGPPPRPPMDLRFVPTAPRPTARAPRPNAHPTGRPSTHQADHPTAHSVSAPNTYPAVRPAPTPVDASPPVRPATAPAPRPAARPGSRSARQSAPRRARRGRVGAWVAAPLLLLLGLGGVAWYAGWVEPAGAAVGECVTRTGGHGVAVVGCGAPEAQFRVAARFEDRTVVDAESSACADVPGSTNSFWRGEDGGLGLVLCLAPVTA